MLTHIKFFFGDISRSKYQKTEYCRLNSISTFKKR
jgi:hypothetical protein